MRYDHSYVEQATVPPLRLWIALALRFYQPTHGYSIYELVLSTGACCHCGAHAAQGGGCDGDWKKEVGGKKNTNTVPIDLQNPWLPPVKHIQRDTVNLLHPYSLRSHWITFNVLHKLSWQEALMTHGCKCDQILQSSAAFATASVHTTTKHHHGIKHNASVSINPSFIVLEHQHFNSLFFLD